MLPAGRSLRARRFAPVHLAPLGCIYDIQRAVADKATVPIHYESRIAKLGLNASELPKLDAEFEEITEGEELTKKESRAAWDAARQTKQSAAHRVQGPRGDDCINRKTKWAALEALVGDPKRIALIAAYLVADFEKRTEAMDGKAMVVCMSRRIWIPRGPARSGFAQPCVLSISVCPLASLGCVDLYEALIKLRPE